MAPRGIRRSFRRMTHSVPSSSADTTAVRPSTWRKASRSTLELAGATGVGVRLYRALVLGAVLSWPVFIAAAVTGLVLVCAVLTWHLSNFPLRDWPRRVALFLGIEVAAEFGMSSVLIALQREPLGSGLATWADWWPLAGQTLLERTVGMSVYAALLAGAMWLVTRPRHRSP